MYKNLIKFDQDGSLDDIIKKHKISRQSIPSEKIQLWTIQLLKAIEFLHSKEIWHSDIKPMNIFMHHNDLVLGDLGLARDSNSIHKTSKTTGMGTICYMAPEIVLESKDYNEKIDIW